MRATLFALLAVLSTGCYRTTLRFDTGPAKGDPTTTMNRGHVFGLWELHSDVVLDALCPGDGVAYVYQHRGAFSIIVLWLSGGIVDGRTVEVFCRAGQHATVTLDGEGRVRSLAWQ